MKSKRWLSLICAIVLVIILAPTAGASDGSIQTTVAETVEEGYPPVPETVTAPSFIVIEQTTGGIAAQKDLHKLMPPASLAKMMTALLVLEAVESGTVKLDEMATASENACNTGGVEIWLMPGEEMSVENLLISILIGSGNDAAVTLAEHVSGSEEAFVAMMNRKAKQIGMIETNFWMRRGSIRSHRPVLMIWLFFLANCFVMKRRLNMRRFGCMISETAILSL